MNSEISGVRERFRGLFRADPAAAYPEWFHLQERLREEGLDALALELADDLWRMIPELEFPGPAERVRFLHDVGVLFGSPGPAGDLSRARACFEAALSAWDAEREPAARSRAQHNLANALANLGSTEGELEEALALYEAALEWRSSEREIARGVTRHHMGLAWRKLAALRPETRKAALDKSAEALREALEIRARYGLSEGHAMSCFHLGVTLKESGSPEAAAVLLAAARELEGLAMPEKAALAREWAAQTAEGAVPTNS
jgi:tetratricopeptide (TPR) repeat protein